MKTKNFRLTLDIEIDPQGESNEDIIYRINQSVKIALNNGTFTGDSPSTVEKYQYNVVEINNEKPKRKYTIRKPGEHHFSNPTDGIPRCITCGCDEDDAFVGGQECSFKRK